MFEDVCGICCFDELALFRSLARAMTDVLARRPDDSSRRARGCHFVFSHTPPESQSTQLICGASACICGGSASFMDTLGLCSVRMSSHSQDSKITRPAE